MFREVRRIQSIVAGDNISVDNTDPANPVISLADLPALDPGIPGRLYQLAGVVKVSL